MYWSYELHTLAIESTRELSKLVEYEVHPANTNLVLKIFPSQKIECYRATSSIPVTGTESRRSLFSSSTVSDFVASDTTRLYARWDEVCSRINLFHLMSWSRYFDQLDREFCSHQAHFLVWETSIVRTNRGSKKLSACKTVFPKS